MRKSAFRRLLLSSGIALLLLDGCVRSEQPLSAMREAKPDSRLVGTWHGEKEPDTKSDDHKTLHLWMAKLSTFQKAVREAKLKGRLDDPKETGKSEETGVLLQDSSDAILRFIEALPPEEAFTKLGISKRVD